MQRRRALRRYPYTGFGVNPSLLAGMFALGACLTAHGLWFVKVNLPTVWIVYVYVRGSQEGVGKGGGRCSG